MSARQRVWANRTKGRLIASMGGVCWACGADGPLFHIDHPNGRDWQPRRKEFSARISLYVREWRQGQVRLLCEACNESNRFNGIPLPPPENVIVGRLLTQEELEARKYDR